MRLQEVYFICKEAYENWVDARFTEKKTPDNTVYYTMDNPKDVSTLLASLARIESFSESIDEIRALSDCFEDTTKSGYFDSGKKNAFDNKYELLANKVNTVVELCEALDLQSHPVGFDVKLPPNITLNDLSKCTRELNTVFSTCPLLNTSDGVISFSSVDVGSVWLSFVIAGTAAVSLLSFVALLIDKAVIIRSHMITAKEQAERVRALGMGNEVLSTTVELYKKIGQKLLEQECEGLAKEHEIDDKEEQERLRNSVQTLAEWMTKGMEIYASIDAAKEVKAVFPPVEKQSLPASAVEMLTEGAKEESG